MNKKAVALFSGGLDSTLAIKLMLEQGIEVYAVYFSFVFSHGLQEDNENNIVKSAAFLGVPIKIIDGTKDLMEMVKKPKHAMGKNMNPCIDCRIFTLRKAKEFMQEIGASFIVTGEVLGERPLSQRRDAIKTIDKESNLEGLILRPLSAKLLEPTMPEKAGIIDRERLLDISGRRRIHQISLAKRFGLNNYQNPAGGCLLTDKGFSGRLEDLLRHNPDYDISDLHLLKVGRHFRISDGLRFIVGRDEKENERLMSFARDGNMIFDIPDIPSPIGLARGKISEKDKESLASILVRYSDCNGDGFTVSYRRPTSEEREKVFANPASQSLLDSLRI